ncbi:interleukin-10 receptor subunit beta [Spea bombifrons]|uniref:interleukin-10 receptor subunit beta n=1 Tax=Spea bombifrons TaxID=233779 RepID=UPI002349D984|nr:interleukin-10 receptor subunit beta [Spea bombifrons]
MCCWYGRLIFFYFFLPAFGEVPTPKNVTMDSVNFRNILRWIPSAATGEDIVYMYQAQYKLDFEETEYRNVCVTNATECDFSLVKYKSLIRVRTKLRNNVSEWVTIRFDPYTQTVISAPRVKVTSRAGKLDVSFSGPTQSDGSSLKDVYGAWIYRLVYWKENTPSDVKTIETDQNYKILPDLDKWTMYCLKVQVYAYEYNNPGHFSPMVCEETTDDGKPPWWIIAIAFISSMLVTAAAVTGIFYFIFKTYQAGRHIFYPSYSIPQHLKEYLSNPFHSPPYPPTQPMEESGESCEELTFVTEDSEETTGAV